MTRPCVILDFPTELVHAIFSHLDSCSLGSCSLVCRQWLPTARCPLFRTIIGRPRHPSLSLERLRQYLSDKPETATLVRKVRLLGKCPGTDEHPLEMYDVIEVISKLPRVRALSFEHVCFAPPRPSSVNLPQYKGPKIVSVSLCGVWRNGMAAEFFRALGGVCALEGLHVSLAVAAPRGLGILQAFLDTLGPRIETLEVDVTGLSCPPSYPAIGGKLWRTSLVAPAACVR